jgi:non-specific serine/threonine protein kinase/serine/threonine-protein kinase
MTTAEWREVEQVLAEALELPEDQQAGYLDSACETRPLIQREARALLSVRRQAEIAFAGPPVVAWADLLAEAGGLAGQKLGPYRVVGLLGAGGMGEVYLAERDDDQFRRQVAIKVVAASMASAEVLTRFRSEREILATLDHPNIARLLDAGILESCRPFFIMEYIDGIPLMEFCRQRNLPLRKRLNLFRAICSAVHFAHQNLIVHRDLKPGNILITGAGVPKLLDFGIAKTLASRPGIAAAVTRLNALPMTPEYASPEQLRGGVITTASDIYALGALLYELLTMERPFRLEGLALEEAARLVTETEPPKPSRAGGHRRALEGDLDAIILKALRSEPRQRYGSAEDLSADVGRYQDGLPVAARRGTVQYVAGKFVARHRAAVAAGVTAVVLLAAGGIALAHSAHVAEAERAKAQQRFDQVRQLANSLVFELYDPIASLPGATAVRKQMVARALQYLANLEEASSGDPGLILNLAQSYERLGSVQGHISEMNLGDPQGALASYGKAVAILQRDPAAARERPHILQELARVYLLRGDVYRDLRDARARDREYEQGLAIIEPLAGRFPNDEAILVLYSTALFGLAKGRAAENAEAGRQLFLRSLAIDERLWRAHPDDWKYQRGLALDHKYLSSVLRSHEEALEHLRQAELLDQQRVTVRPQDGQARLDLSYDLSEMSSHLVETGDLARALELSRRVQSIRNELAAADPRDAQIRLRVITAGKAMGVVLAKMGRLEAALAEYRTAATKAEAAVAAVPADPRNRVVLGELDMEIASTESKIGARGQACRDYASAAEVLGGLVKEKIATTEESNLAQEAEQAAALCRGKLEPTLPTGR